MNWFYEAGGQQQGPISEADLDRLIGEGRITPKTLVWREGLPDWQPLAVARPESDPNSGKCGACGEIFPVGDLIQIGGRSICSNCKPAVLQELQQSGILLGLGEEDRTEPAWERRKELGLFNAAWQTLQAVLVKPVETFSAMRREGGLLSPYTYALLMGSIGGIANVLYQIAMNSVMRQPLPPNFPPELVKYMEFAQGPAFLIGCAIFMPILVTISSTLSSGILHLALMLCGGANRPFETTYRVYCYSYGSATALQIIPVCGGSVASIWQLVCICIGLAKAHETETWRAVLAVLLPLVVCCTGFIALITLGVIMTARIH